MKRATVETGLAHAVSSVVLWAALLSVAFPLAWILLTSFKPVSKIYQMPPVLFFKPTPHNYYKALVENDSLRVAFLNSIIVALTTSQRVMVFWMNPYGSFLASSAESGSRALAFRGTLVS